MSTWSAIQTRSDDWIFEEYRQSTEGLATYRVVFALYLFLMFVPWPGTRTWLAEVPDSVYAPPPGPMALFGGFPPEWFLYGLEVGAFVAAGLLIFGLGRRWTALTVGICMLLLNGFLYSTGKIDHGSHLLVATPLVMAFSPWAGTGEGDEHGLGRSWPLAFLALLVGFGMFTAGLEKFLWGWLWPGDHAVQNFTFRKLYVYGNEGLLAAPLQTLVPGAGWEPLDWTTVVFEIGFFFAVFSRRWFRGFCGAAVVFHVGVFLVLSISFVDQLAVYAAFLNWDTIARHDWVRQTRQAVSNVWQESSRSGRLGYTLVAAGLLVATKFGIDHVLAEIKINGDALPNYLLFAAGLGVVALGTYRALTAR